MTIGGLISVLTGSAVALTSAFREIPDIRLIVVGLVFSLLGAGIIHPNMVINFLKARRNGNGK